MYLHIDNANGYIQKECAMKHLVFDSLCFFSSSKELLKKHNNVWSGIKNKIEEVSDNKYIMKKITWKLTLILMMTYH